jgi:LPXTG-motif cell wall-anchored protein
VLLVWIGVQPPNEKALTATLAALALLAAAWWLAVRRRFEGPPAVD